MDKLSDKCYKANCDGDECPHNNTLTNECSDCNEQELFDDMLDYTLSEIYSMLFKANNTVTDIIDDYQKHGGMQDNDIKNKVEQEVLNRLTLIYNKQGNTDEK